MKRLRVGILDFLTNKTTNPWFESHAMLPNFAAIMPQCVGVWAEELGCEVFYETYTGREDLSRSLPEDLDFLFLSSFSRASYLAYAVSSAYRKRGTITILGGPHARSFAHHSKPYFDFVCQLTDKAGIQSIFQDQSHHSPGVILNAGSQPKTLPTVRERERFIQVNVVKSDVRKWFRTIPMIGSLGCPYTCNFCVDAAIPYQTLPYREIVEDLRFIAKRWGADSVAFWHDPNFGVRFKEYNGLIEESGAGLRHGGESSLSLMGEANLKLMQKNRWICQVPGIESWYDFNGKGHARTSRGLDKVKKVAEHCNLILEYVPYLQTNFVLGLDTDVGAEPFELTKTFVDLAPGAFPGYSLVTDFQNSPLSTQLRKEDRTLPVPHPFLDNNFSFNVKLKNYGLIDFYDKLIDLQAHTWGNKALYRRYQATPHRYAKVTNFARGLTEGRWRWRHFKYFRNLLRTDPSFLRFHSGEQREAPQLYFDLLKGMLGDFYPHLPKELTTPAAFLTTMENHAPQEHEIPLSKLEVPLPEAATAGLAPAAVA